MRCSKFVVTLFLLISLVGVFAGGADAASRQYTFSWTGLADTFEVPIPVAIYFSATESGSDVFQQKGLLLEGNERITVYVNVQDSNKNGIIDHDDFDWLSIPVSFDVSVTMTLNDIPASEDAYLSGTINTDVDGLELTGTSSAWARYWLSVLHPEYYDDLMVRFEQAYEAERRTAAFATYVYKIQLTNTEDVFGAMNETPQGIMQNFLDYKSNFGRIRVIAYQVTEANGSTTAAGYDEAYGTLQFRVYLGLRSDTTFDGTDRVGFDRTTMMAVTVRAFDTGGDGGDNGGGSCSAGFGGLALLLPMVLIRRRRG